MADLGITKTPGDGTLIKEQNLGDVSDSNDTIGGGDSSAPTSGMTTPAREGSQAEFIPPIGAGAILPSNPDDTNCYCGKGRDLKVCEFQCGMCQRFYHEQCLSIQVGLCVPFMTNYQFFCNRCSTQESFMKKPASFSQMCHTAVANLTGQNPDRKFFSKDKEIIPFIDKFWEHLTTTGRRVKLTWHSTIAKTMTKDVGLFQMSGGETGGDNKFGLVHQDLVKIGPNCESLFRLTGAPIGAASKASAATEAKDIFSGKLPVPAKSSRSAKRKAPGDGTTNIVKQRRGDMSSTKVAPKSYPVDHPYNKDGYRYHLAEPDPHAPNWQAYDESVEWAGKPIPGYLYRLYQESTVMLAVHDRAPQLKLTHDRMTVTGDKGYSMIRGTHGVNHGRWYFEVTIDEMPEGTATRIGWSQCLGNLQAPCGYDKFSYSWRSRKGTRFHQSRGKHYSGQYKEKDVLGFLIDLPEPSDQGELVPQVYKDKPLIKFKSHLYYEEKDYTQDTAKKLNPLEGSKMSMFLNGKNQGVAFEDVFKGTYYPAVSLYKNSTVTMNFGPDFRCPPQGLTNYKAMSVAAEEAYVSHALGDILYHVQNEGQLPEF